MMVHMLRSAHDWLIWNPIAHELILFFLSGLVSLYSKQIREFLRDWPARTLRNFDRNINVNRLRLIEGLHNDTYNLLIYLASSIVAIFHVAVIWNGILAIGSIVFFHSSALSVPHLESTVFGIAVGKVFQVGEVLKQLTNYDASVAYMRKIIAQRDADELESLTGSTYE